MTDEKRSHQPTPQLLPSPFGMDPSCRHYIRTAKSYKEHIEFDRPIPTPLQIAGLRPPPPTPRHNINRLFYHSLDDTSFPLPSSLLAPSQQEGRKPSAIDPRPCIPSVPASAEVLPGEGAPCLSRQSSYKGSELSPVPAVGSLADEPRPAKEEGAPLADE